MDNFELVVPAYNESKNLPTLIRRACAAAEAAGLSPQKFQFVIVNNGSRDDSADILENLKNGPLAPWFRIVNVEINMGYGYGVLQGLISTTAPIVGWSHADMQCDPSDAIKAFKMVSETSEKVLVKGVRDGRDWKDRMVSRVFELFSTVILGMGVYELNAQPKVFRRALLTQLRNPPKTFAFDLYVIYIAVKNRYSIQTIPVKFPPRIHGVSNWASTFFGRYKTILGMIRYMLELRKQEGSAKR